MMNKFINIRNHILLTRYKLIENIYIYNSAAVFQHFNSSQCELVLSRPCFSKLTMSFVTRCYIKCIACKEMPILLIPYFFGI